MYHTLITGPATEPVLLADAKAHLRVEVTDDDTLITNMIVAARRLVESFINQKIIYQTWSVTYDMNDRPFRCNTLRLFDDSAVSITSITSYDHNNNASVMDSSTYRLSNNQVILNYLQQWPSTADRDQDVLVIVYVTGLATNNTTVPQDIKQAMMMIIAHWYENREASSDPTNPVGQTMVPAGVYALLAPYKIYHV